MQADHDSDLLQSIDLLHGQPIERILSPIVRFSKLEAAGGLVLLVSTVATLAWANSPWAMDRNRRTGCRKIAAADNVWVPAAE